LDINKDGHIPGAGLTGETEKAIHVDLNLFHQVEINQFIVLKISIIFVIMIDRSN